MENIITNLATWATLILFLFYFVGRISMKVLRSRFKDANYRYLYYALKSVKIPNTGYNRHFKWLKHSASLHSTKEYCRLFFWHI